VLAVNVAPLLARAKNSTILIAKADIGIVELTPFLFSEIQELQIKFPTLWLKAGITEGSS